MVAVNLEGVHSFNTTLTANDTSQKETMGALRWEDNGKAYRYVQNSSGSVNLANGNPVVYESVGAFIITGDISDGASADGQTVAGVAIGTLSTGNFGWLQVWGHHASVSTNADDDVTTGCLLFVSDDIKTDATTAGTAVIRWPLGVALADDSNGADTVAAFIRCYN